MLAFIRLNREHLGNCADTPAQLLECGRAIRRCAWGAWAGPPSPTPTRASQQFHHGAKRLREVVPTLALSLANSSGIFLGSDYHFDLVRPGASLYGVNPTPSRPNPMRQVVSLRLPILQIKDVSGPASVGYDATFTISAGEQCRLATVAGGYADGIFAYLSNRGYGFFAGHRVPIVGRVSMDSTIFDLSAVDDHSLNNTDQLFIDVLDERHGVDALAEEAGTIGYEVLTALGNRYAREYRRFSE